MLLIVQSLSHVFLWPHALPHARLSCPSPIPGIYSNSYPLRGDAIQPSHPLLAPSPPALNLCNIRVFSNESTLHIRWRSTVASASASVLLMNIKYWFTLELTGLISLLSKWLSRVFQGPTGGNNQFLVLSLLYGPTVTFIHNYWKNHSFYYK